ncbi:MAG: hypothetical protein Q8Q37_01430, partial [bacterium]|nr:hypothetical protein [bacterium]
MPKPALITSRDPKGLHAVGLFEAAYNKSKLDEARAQRLNERGGELQDGIAKLIAELTAELTDITPPQGGRTYDLSVTVDESRNWREAINTAGPDTSSNNNVWRVGDWYPTQNV